MRDPKRIDHILNRLKQVWETHPDLRLGQLILNVVEDPTLYYIEDDDLIDRLEQTYADKKEDPSKGYFTEGNGERYYHYKGFTIKLLDDEAGQQVYFIFNGKEYSCGSFNPYPELEIEAVIDNYLKNKERAN